MKKYVIIAAAALLLCGLVSCGDTSASSVISETVTTAMQTSETTSTTTVETATSATTTKATTTAETATTSAETTAVPETTAETSSPIHQTIDRKVEVDEETFNAVAFVEQNYYDEKYNIFDGTNYINYDNEICFLVDQVSKVPNDTLGAVADEADLIAKAKEVFIAVLGQDFIDRVEADHIERNGEMLAITERINPTYITQYYEEYDVWWIRPCLPSGILEDGSHADTIFDNPPFLIVKGDSGKIIACRF